MLVPLFVIATSPEAVTDAALKAAPLTVILFNAVDPPTAPEKVMLSVPASTTKFLPEEFPLTVPVKVMESLFASIVDEAVQEAINEGISAATAEAAIRAVMEVFERGGTEQEAMNACRAIAGDAC